MSLGGAGQGGAGRGRARAERGQGNGGAGAEVGRPVSCNHRRRAKPGRGGTELNVESKVRKTNN
jgi:hypothetical protein